MVPAKTSICLTHPQTFTVGWFSFLPWIIIIIWYTHAFPYPALWAYVRSVRCMVLPERLTVLPHAHTCSSYTALLLFWQLKTTPLVTTCVVSRHQCQRNCQWLMYILYGLYMTTSGRGALHVPGFFLCRIRQLHQKLNILIFSSHRSGSLVDSQININYPLVTTLIALFNIWF